MVLAKWAAPPSGRSSRATAVTTTKRRPMAAAASATRRGSSGSGGPMGRAVITLQKRQPRVQWLPAIMKVAVPRDQHLPMFGQAASSQTVTRSDERISALVWTNPEERGFLATTQRGSRRRSQSWASCSPVTSTGSRSSRGPVADQAVPEDDVGDVARGARGLHRLARGDTRPLLHVNARSTAMPSR